MSTRIVNKRLVPVEDLVMGLYVCELDRPWLGTPFSFQGFAIEEEADIRELRRLCTYVYVDADRSRPAALSRLHSRGPASVSASRRGGRVANVITLPPPARRGVHRDTRDAFGDDAYPDEGRFRELVRIARGVRERSRAVVDRVFRDARLGQSIDANGTREVIRELVATISENASASLWLTNLKKRDEYTSLHCVNVCVLAIAFGRHLGLPEARLQTLGLGALLHDIGKMRTPDGVLLKPAALTPEEFEIMKRHPLDGDAIMRTTGRIPETALAIIRNHHERLSGRGYPDGLRGDAIPLPVMIAALADVYDAMTSDRVYHDGLPPDRVLRALYEGGDTEYGREIVEEFIRCLGIYPTGSVVELDSGALAVVIASDPRARLRPVVRLVRTPDGESYDKRVLVNLAALADDPAMPTWTVTRVVDGAEHGVEVAAILAAELDGV